MAIYKEGDIPTIIQYITDIITGDDLYRKMSEKSLEFVQQIFRLRFSYSIFFFFPVFSSKIRESSCLLSFFHYI